MDDVIAFVMSLLKADTVLQALFPGNACVVVAPNGNDESIYPSIVVSSSEGKDFVQGEPGALIKSAVLYVSVFGRDGEEDRVTDDVWTMAQRCSLLIVGDPYANIPGLSNKRVTNVNGDQTWIVMSVRAVDPSGPRETHDPKVKNNVVNFDLQILRVR